MSFVSSGMADDDPPRVDAVLLEHGRLELPDPVARRRVRDDRRARLAMRDDRRLEDPLVERLDRLLARDLEHAGPDARRRPRPRSARR